MTTLAAETASSMRTAITATDLLIGGGFISAVSGARFNVFDPSTEELLATVADASIEDADKALEAAANAAAGWAEMAPRGRAAILMRAFDLMTENSERLATLISMENGKALTDARGEVAYAAEFFRWYAEEAVRLSGSLLRSPGGQNNIVVSLEPAGIAMLVTPWNFPAAMATRKIAPALAAGCTTILKPAKETPLTALAIGELLIEAGVPAGVVNMVTTSRAGALTSSILHDPRVRVISFTGSTEVGKILLKEAADNVVRPAMELGGNAPFIVLADADLDAAVEGALTAKMRNGGQACTAANRFYIHSSLYEDFIQRLTAKFEKLRMGVGYDPTTDLGPLVNAASVDKVHELVQDAASKGAKIVLGGTLHEGPGYFYPPTILRDVPNDAAIVREEIFGPVAAISSFESVDEVVAAANSSEYGLVSYVYTSDLAMGMQVARYLDSGMVGLNRGLVSDAAAPFGGTKQSGLGREGAKDGILEFIEQKYIAVDW